ncbi:DUF3000 domain-containing protein [Humidisolicoccus flavus]|uniref:DUF3000 domain-containing protein n=1 Tax=Humidisolicoccus flavus TaxID=3111414 RepID=UPI0032566B15
MSNTPPEHSEPGESTYPPAFRAALEQLRAAPFRDELSVREIPAPGSIAPWSVALSADIGAPEHGRDSELGTGRFILMHDPEEPEAWGGSFRVVSFMQASHDTEIAADQFVAAVAWSWLEEALEQREAQYHSPSGTVTKILSSGFGSLEAQGDGAQLEMRASWTPDDANFGAHIAAWCDILCALAGHSVRPGAVGLDAARGKLGR